MPGQQMPDFGDLFSFDKLAHTAVFCILCFFMIIGFTKQYAFQKLGRNPIKYSLIISGLYAGLLELGQALVPGRSTNFYDLVFNIVGVFLGYLLFLMIYKFSFV
jgi:VanZ family protein